MINTLSTGKDNFYRQMLKLTIPIIIQNLLSAAVNSADVIMLNYVGQSAISAVSLAANYSNILFMVYYGLGTGASLLCAQYFGKNNMQAIHAIEGIALRFSIIISGIVALIAFTAPQLMMKIFTSDQELISIGSSYLRIMGITYLCWGITEIYLAILRSIGRVTISMALNMLAFILNIILNATFIFGLFGAPKLGVAGAAIATDISQLVSCVLSLRFLMRVEDDYRVTAKEVRVHKKMAVRIIKVGLPTGIQNMVISLSNVLVQVSVNGYGAAAMAGFAAYMKVDGFNILPVLSFSMAATTFVGQNFGAGKIDRVKKGTFVTLGMCIVYTILTGILLLAFQDPIMHLFTGDETVIAYGKICMLYFCPFYWMLGILQGLAGTVRGTGKSVPPMVVLLISLCLFRIVWIQFALPLFAGIEGVLLVYPVSWAVGAVLMVLYAWKGKWMQLPEAIS